MTSPVAEIELTETEVRSLLADQHPDLAALPLVHLDAGWDNVLWRLGGELVVRLPRRAIAVPGAVNEQRWLSELAPCLPLPVPVPARLGQPAARYPWPWSIVPWLEGVPGDRAEITDLVGAARRLGLFLRALHQPAPANAPINPFRSTPLAARDPGIRRRLRRLAGDSDTVSVWWDRALAAEPWAGPPVWIHGDLHPANVLIAGGTVAAVIDFGDLCAGDPATDLAGAWMLLPVSSHPAFWDAYGAVDADLWQRAIGWTISFSSLLLEIGLDDKPSYTAVAQATLARLTPGSVAFEPEPAP